MSDAVLLKDERRAARKCYKCDAYAWFVNSGMGRNDLTPDQQLILDAAEADRGLILIGQQYNYRRGAYDGHMFTWRSKPGMDAVNEAHGLYDDY